MFASFFLFITFGSLSFKIIENSKILIIINGITKYTGGIYYIHPRVRRILRKISKYFYNSSSYSSSILLYIVCYIICFIGTKIFRNSKLKYLFN